MSIRTKAAAGPILASLLLAAAAGACQSAVPGHPATSAPLPSSTSGAPTTTPTHPSPPTRPPSAFLPIETPTPTSGPPPGGTRQTLIGTAYQGAEPSCIGLRVGAASYELNGNPVSKLGNGGYGQALGHVRVVGHLASPTIASHCMMGRIFEVDTLTKL